MNTFQHYFIGLFAVANNFSAITPFLALVAGLSAAQYHKVVGVSTLASFIIMVISMFLGSVILEFFGISISAFQIAGGVLLVGVGISMLNAKSTSDVSGKQVETSLEQMSNIVTQAIVPIAMPLTAGAGTISTVTVFSHSAAQSGTMVELFLAIVAMTLVIGVIFRYALVLTKLLGRTGMNVLVKVMGLFTLAIGIQFIISGVSTIALELMHKAQ